MGAGLCLKLHPAQAAAAASAEVTSLVYRCLGSRQLHEQWPPCAVQETSAAEQALRAQLDGELAAVREGLQGSQAERAQVWRPNCIQLGSTMPGLPSSQLNLPEGWTCSCEQLGSTAGVQHRVGPVHQPH